MIPRIPRTFETAVYPKDMIPQRSNDEQSSKQRVGHVTPKHMPLPYKEGGQAEGCSGGSTHSGTLLTDLTLPRHNQQS